MSANLKRVKVNRPSVKLLSVLALVLTTVLTSQALEPSSTTSGSINGHEWVDLGLSVKWATCNVGASSPSGYGNYYAWGETKTKSTYTEENSKTEGKNIGDIAGNPSYDVARANWGSTWRLPTKAEMQELVDKCTWTWTIQGGHNGYRVTGPNGNSIFLPATGGRFEESLYDAGSWSAYWSSTPYKSDSGSALSLNFDSGCAFSLIFDSDYHNMDSGNRIWGFSVRPVLK